MAGLSLKPGSGISGIKPEMVLGLMIVKSVFDAFSIDMIITEGTKGKHMANSLHYGGLAADIRSKHIATSKLKMSVLQKAQAALGDDFDFILESEGKINEHFHMEYQPK